MSTPQASPKNKRLLARGKGWTMVKLEEFYACNRAEAEEKEQEYINKYCPSLNMCARLRSSVKAAVEREFPDAFADGVQSTHLGSISSSVQAAREL